MINDDNVKGIEKEIKGLKIEVFDQSSVTTSRKLRSASMSPVTPMPLDKNSINSNS